MNLEGRKMSHLPEVAGMVNVNVSVNQQTCGNCKHWRKKPADVSTLGKPNAGECHESLRVIAIHLPRGGVQIQSLYPPCDKTLVACGRFEAKVEVAT